MAITLTYTAHTTVPVEVEGLTPDWARDKTLAMPRLILPSVQVNMRAGHMPPAEDNGIRYLKIPVDAI